VIITLNQSRILNPKKSITMKKLIICLCLVVAIGAMAAEPPEVNEKVLKAFNETFMKATDVVWHEMQNSYEARFKQSEIVTRAIYDTEGNLLRTTRYYAVEHPLLCRRAPSDTYPFKAEKEICRQVSVWSY
jgi:hypothetical protein